MANKWGDQGRLLGGGFVWAQKEETATWREIAEENLSRGSLEHDALKTEQAGLRTEVGLRDLECCDPEKKE